MKLIHYGADKYDVDKFCPIGTRIGNNKPMGGLWTSPLNSKFGWAEWCTGEEWYTHGLKKYFILKFKGTMLVINNIKDMNKLPWVKYKNYEYISFRKFCRDKFTYDAIHLTIKGQNETRLTHPRSLYGWDCETVLVLNPAAIQPC